MTTATAPMFILTASRRAKRLREGAKWTSWDEEDWLDDEEGLRRRRPNGELPDIGIQRSASAEKLIKEADRLNRAQMQSGFLDFFFSVDYDTPIHGDDPDATPNAVHTAPTPSIKHTNQCDRYQANWNNGRSAA